MSKKVFCLLLYLALPLQAVPTLRWFTVALSSLLGTILFAAMTFAFALAIILSTLPLIALLLTGAIAWIGDFAAHAEIAVISTPGLMLKFPFLLTLLKFFKTQTLAKKKARYELQVALKKGTIS